MVIAVVDYVASCSRLRVVRKRLLGLRADRDFVLRGCGLSCRLLILGRWSCLLRLDGRIRGLNRLDGTYHAYHLAHLTSTRGEKT